MTRRTTSARRHRRRRRAVALSQAISVAVSLAVSLAVASLVGVGALPVASAAANSPVGPRPRSSAPVAHGAPPRRGLNQVVPVGPSALWALTQNETRLSGGAQSVELTTNAGRTWSNVTPPGLAVDGGERYLNGLVALSATRAWIDYGAASSGPSFLATTSDGGRHWSRVGTLPPSGCLLQFVSPREGTCTVLGGAAGSMAVIIYRTVDGGATWRQVFANRPSTTTTRGSLPFGCDKTISFANATTGWALFFCNAGSGAIIDATTNGGATWTPCAVTPPRSVPEGGGGFTGPVVVRGARGAVPYVVGGDAALYVTHDDGRSFTPVYPPGPPRPWAVDVISPTQWRLTLGREVLGTNDAGASWFRFTSSTVLHATSYGRGAPPGGLVTFTTQSDAWLFENAGGSNAVLLRSSDGGRSWRRVAVPGVG